MTREEIKNKVIEIPEGYEARIEGNRVVIEQKESEDERIRKWLVELVKNTDTNHSNIKLSENCKLALAYLEKQKEQKPAKDTALQEAFINSKIDYTLEEKCDASDYAEIILPTSVIYGENEEEYKLHKIIEAAFIAGQKKEQKPAEWSDDYREEDLRTRFAFYTYKDEDDVLYLSNVFVEETSRNKGFGTKILAAAEKVAETLGAINIRLKVKQNSPANAWYRKHGYGYMAFEDGYDWLEKTLEYLKPNKQERSEEDEKKIHFLSRLIELQVKDDKYCFGDGSLISKQEAIEMLNSLRPSWKPSEEQMEHLKKVYESYDFCDGERDALESLYYDLKKLI